MAPITWRNIDAPNLNGVLTVSNSPASLLTVQLMVSISCLKHSKELIVQTGTIRPDQHAGCNRQAERPGQRLQDLNAQEGSFDPTALRSTYGQQFDPTAIVRSLAEQKAKLTGDAVTAAGTTGLNVADSTHSSCGAGCGCLPE